MFKSRVIVFGTGNILMGDDGVGPAVVEYLEKDKDIPEDVGLLDVGTSIKQVLFDLHVLDPKPKRMIVVDAVTHEGRAPGEFWEINPDDVPIKAVREFSLHLFPTVNMLQEIKENTKVDVRIVVMQIAGIPDEMFEGLSPEIEAAVPKMAEYVKKIILEG